MSVDINTDAGKPLRFSDIVKMLAAREDTSVATLVVVLGERAFGALMFILAIPNIIPTPPGTSAILGLPLLFLTFQLMVGRTTLWLPHFISKRVIRKEVLQGFAKRLLPPLTRIEKLVGARLTWLASSPLAERLLGLVACVLALILFLPIPLGNILPATGIAVLAIGLAERDGLAVVMGHLLALTSVGVLVLLSSAIYESIIALVRLLTGG